MMTEPKLEQRNAQPYMGIRIQVPIKAFSTVLPRLLADLRAWMSARGLARAGAPFLRFHVIDTQTRMDIEMGIPVDRALPDDGPVCAGVLPAGRYACLTYTGVSNGIKGNQTLLDWGAAQGLV